MLISDDASSESVLSELSFDAGIVHVSPRSKELDRPASLQDSARSEELDSAGSIRGGLGLDQGFDEHIVAD